MDPLQGKVKGVDLGADILFRVEPVQDHLRFEKINTRTDRGTTIWFQIQLPAAKRRVRGHKTGP